MKKLRVNEKYGKWYYEILKDYDMDFKIYQLQNEEKTESYQLGFYTDMINLVKEPTRELREKYEKIYG